MSKNSSVNLLLGSAHPTETNAKIRLLMLEMSSLMSIELTAKNSRKDNV